MWVVAELIVLEFGGAKQAVCKPSSSGDGYRGEEPLAGDVSDRGDTGNVGVLLFDDVALRGSLDAKSSEDSLTADEMGLGSEGVEDTSEFNGNVTSTNDDDPFRLVFEFGEAIRGDTEGGSRDLLVRGDDGVTADGDTNVVGLKGSNARGRRKGQVKKTFPRETPMSNGDAA